MRIDIAGFGTRDQRAEYIVREFGEHLTGSVLDVGCDECRLRHLLGDGITYTGIDIGGTPDIRIDLDAIDRLPFDDAAFDAVVCTDVLEHLEHLHLIFDELARVARGRLIISLPNNWVNARQPIARGRGHIGYYGLPIEKPNDRHKWFFSMTEAREFLEGQTRRLPIEIIEMRAVEKPRPLPIRWALHLVNGRGEKYLNRYAHTLWAVIAKR